MNDILQIDIEGARRLTERIRLTAVTVTESVDRLKTLVARAKESGAHTALGYASWTAYLSEVLGETPMRLERDTRQELVAELTAQGMSTRAIAPIVGITRQMVSKDLHAEQVATQLPPVHADQFDRDVAEAAAATSPAVEANPDTGEVIEPEAPRVVEGMDGKTYKVPAKKPQTDNPSADLTLVNDIRLYLRKLASSPQVSRLTPAGKQHIITALQDAITQIEKD